MEQKDTEIKVQLGLNSSISTKNKWLNSSDESEIPCPNCSVICMLLASGFIILPGKLF